MSDGKIKQAAGKIPLQLLPLGALEGVARVFGYGAKKYAPGNWATATDPDAVARYAGAVLRHLGAMQQPNGLFTFESATAQDEESGLPHVDHLLASVIMLRGLLQVNAALDSDPGKGNEPIVNHGTPAAPGFVFTAAKSEVFYSDDNKADGRRPHAPARLANGHFPGCASLGCDSTRCREPV